MKNLIRVLGWIALAVTISQSQTVIWRVEGQYNLAAQDNQGNTYLARGYRADGASGDPDTLVKVNPAGEVIWKVPVASTYYQLLPTSAGVYLAPPRYLSPAAAGFCVAPCGFKW